MLSVGAPRALPALLRPANVILSMRPVADNLRCWIDKIIGLDAVFGLNSRASYSGLVARMSDGAGGDKRTMSGDAGARAARGYDGPLSLNGARSVASDVVVSEALAMARPRQSRASGLTGGVAGSAGGQPMAKRPDC